MSEIKCSACSTFEQNADLLRLSQVFETQLKTISSLIIHEVGAEGFNFFLKLHLRSINQCELVRSASPKNRAELRTILNEVAAGLA